MQESLKSHYERKYVHENKDHSIPSIPKVKIPTSRFEAVIKFFPQYFKGGSILELAAGDGRVAKTLLESDPGIESYVATDISAPRLQGLKNNLKDPRLSILEMNAEDIPETEYGKYDAVIMMALVEHLVEPFSAMQSIGKLLKPGGFVYIDTPNFAKFTRRLKLLAGRFPSTAAVNEGLTTYKGQPVDIYDNGHLHYFTYRSLSLMLTQRCGFSHIVKLGHPINPYFINKPIHNYLSLKWPELFAELVILAYV